MMNTQEMISAYKLIIKKRESPNSIVRGWDNFVCAVHQAYTVQEPKYVTIMRHYSESK